MLRPRVTLAVLMTALCLPMLLRAAEPASTQQAQTVSDWDEARYGPLPRVREGGPPPYNPDQAMQPYAVHLGGAADVPTSGLIESPPEYWPTDGVVFRYSTYSWSSVVTDLVAGLTGDPAHDEIAYVVVSSTSVMNSAISQFNSAGADLSKIKFIIKPTDSIWIRDYGPHFIWQANTRAIVDSHYYPSRPLDNFIPTLLADDYFLMPSYDIGLYYSGGNFQPGPNRSGFVTSLIHEDNPGFGDAFIGELYDRYQGIDTLYIMPRLPSWVDGTGHIDMWFYLIDDDTVIISEFLPGSDSQAIRITDDAAEYMEDTLGFEVIRVPAWNVGYTHYTYTNAFRVNNRIFIPSYGQGNSNYLPRDAEALAAFQAAAPECEILPINSYSIIPAAGALHCIVMQVPRYTEEVPAAHVVSPDGGELLVAGAESMVAWSASDNVGITSVDVQCSMDGGETYEDDIALSEVDDGFVSWSLADAVSGQARLRIVAYDGDGNFAEAFSEELFTIARADQRVYDFSTDASVDKWGWGYQTLSWSQLNGVQHPASVSAEISELVSGAYQRLAQSDASGGDSDSLRYQSPFPSGSNESTHIFDFTIYEAPSRMLDIGLAWEGYGDACLQMELYVWDFVEQQWCDGAGACGENRFVDNQAANVDADLSGHIRSDFDRYIGPGGEMTLLLYAERSGQRSFHDYISVTVTTAVTGDLDVDGDIDATDFAMFGDCLAGPFVSPGGADCVWTDFEEDNDVDLADVAAMFNAFTGN